MDKNREKVQWSLLVCVVHGPGFGHRIEMNTQTTGRGPYTQSLGSWTGLGVPESVLQDAMAVVNAALVEHLVTRYGVQGELPVTWAGEPDPF